MHRMGWLFWGGALVVAGFACASSETVDPGFEELGSGGDASSSSSTTSTSVASTSASTSGATSTSATTTSTSATTTSTSSGPQCNDPGPEPNETEAAATSLPAMDDCDPDPYPSFGGILADGDDVDWFKYKASDASFCSVDPLRNFTVVGGARLCKFAKCDSGTTEVTCAGSATADTSPAGYPGCCDSGSVSMSDVNCTGTLSDDTTIYIRVDQGLQDCLSYTIDYHY